VRRPDPKIVSVFGSGRAQPGDSHYTEAQKLGGALVAQGFIVCTGGYGGVMEAASRGAKEAGGRTIGVTAAFFSSRANQWIDREVRVKTWRDRLFQLVERADGYVVCRGGTGTLVELAVVWELMNKKVMSGKPIVTLGDFWEPIVQCIDGVEKERGPQSSRWKSFIHFASSPRAAAEYLSSVFHLPAQHPVPGTAPTRYP
jgi:uncharacterized protein (TIGR00725 family)